jgi:glycosyltransferase involved in cell wall biosynthesis
MSYQNEKILVAICNFNHGHFLKQSIESIQEQSYKNLDICVVDDGSYDQETIELLVSDLQSQDNRIRLLKNKSNLGKWHCLNSAIATTNAAICTSHDADDVSLPWRISAQLTALKATETAHNLCGLLHCWSEKEVEEGRGTTAPESLGCISKEETVRFVSQGFQSPGCNHYYTGNFETAGVSAMFLKKVWDIGFRFNPPGLGLRVLHSEDSDFNCRVTLGLQSTSILAERPYLYRRNTSTNKEER